MTRQTTKVFGIDTIDDYLAFCKQAVGQLEQDQDDVLHAFAAILALNHIPDWLQYKLTNVQRAALGLVGLQFGESVKEFFEGQNNDLERVREISNGFKHLRLTRSTEHVTGFGRGPYGVGPYGVSYLLIDLGDHLPPADRWDVALSLCKRVLEWWQKQLSCLVQTTGGNHYV